MPDCGSLHAGLQQRRLVDLRLGRICVMGWCNVCAEPFLPIAFRTETLRDAINLAIAWVMAYCRWSPEIMFALVLVFAGEHLWYKVPTYHTTSPGA
jgi:hypothetical protein